MAKGGLCGKHGGGSTAACNLEGCTTFARASRRCTNHGAVRFCACYTCKSAAVYRGLCYRHGGGTAKECSIGGCKTMLEEVAVARTGMKAA
eukprot:gene16076-biopygen1466